MRKILAIGLASALATASVGASTSSAQATGFGGALLTGVLIGVGVLALTHHFTPFTTRAYAYDYAYPTYSVNAHVTWCQQRYRTYNKFTDTFTGFDGFQHQCIGPY
jgi:hypothetical protein